MKKLLLLLIFINTGLLAKEPLKLYVESYVYYVPNDETQNIQDITHMKKNYGGYNENHSYKDEPGGEWNLETRLSEANIFNIKFWIKDKNNPEINQNIDVSEMELSTISLLKNQQGELKINITPKKIPKPLSPIKLSIDNFGLNHFCFKNSAMIIDDNFYIGKLQGFAERVEIRLPDFYDIDVALKPMRDWQPIGVYQDGVINIDVGENHILTLLNVGIGPSGYQKGGPFKVYGKLKAPTHDRQDLLDSAAKYDFENVSERIKSIIVKANNENKYSVAGISTAANNTEHLSRVIGEMFMFDDDGCG